MEVTFEAIIKKAEERAAKPFREPKADWPEFLQQLNYDTYREIQFRHDQALWKKEDLSFRLEFFHPGYIYLTPVKAFEFTQTHAQPIRFVEDFFNYGKLNAHKRIPTDAGYAGFRLLYQVNTPGKWDETASFLGASYFRMLGTGQRYGASARGLALNCGEGDAKEEFPAFTEWWLGKPEKNAETMRVYGILESAHAVGAYEFLIRPGEATVADVNVVLFFRDFNGLKNVGLAPLTSMFWFGENSERKPDDYRAEVHDSDGLLIREQNEWSWHPLANPSSLKHSAVAMKEVRGFGLMQRDRDFSHYEDMANEYQKTPSVWVEPRGNWGEGELHLVEIPANSEGMDNIVAFWNPKDKPAPMQAFRYGYTLFWALQPDAKFQAWKVLQTRVGVNALDAKQRRFVIDFDGPNMDPAPEIVLHVGDNASTSDAQVTRNEARQSWRVVFSLTPKAGEHEEVNIECALKSAGKDVSEIWKYQWTPP